MTEGAGVVLDAGAFIALERGSRVMARVAARFFAERTRLVTSAGVVAQVWRGGARRQAAVAMLLHRTEVVDLTRITAMLIGRMLASSGANDPIDAHVVLLAQERGWAVVTSDPADLRALDPSLRVERI